MKFHFTDPFPRIADLIDSCKLFYGIPQDQLISLAKYVPHNFEWKWFDPEMECVEKIGKKKKTEVKFKAGDGDLRKMPFLLRDGDIIGVRIESDNADG